MALFWEHVRSINHKKNIENHGGKIKAESKQIRVRNFLFYCQFKITN